MQNAWKETKRCLRFFGRAYRRDYLGGFSIKTRREREKIQEH
jgi:hypothetical protein